MKIYHGWVANTVRGGRYLAAALADNEETAKALLTKAGPYVPEEGFGPMVEPLVAYDAGYTVYFGIIPRYYAGVYPSLDVLDRRVMIWPDSLHVPESAPSPDVAGVLRGFIERQDKPGLATHEFERLQRAKRLLAEIGEGSPEGAASVG